MKTMAWLGVAAAVASGCGGSSGGGSCGKAQPCGGDLHGTWNLDTFWGAVKIAGDLVDTRS
jgi:hypothetical protein